MTAELPVRDDLRGSTPYGAPQLDVPVRLNTNENSYDVPQDVAIAVVEAVARQVQHLNRYPDREFVELRAALAGYLSQATGEPVEPDQVWAANGSNEVLQQLLQAFGGTAGARWASRRRTRCTRGSPRSPAPPGWTAIAATRPPATST